MALQSKVSQRICPAIAGMPASVVETHYLAKTPQAATAIPVGAFVFADTTDPNKVSNTGTGMVRGIAIFVRGYVSPGTTPSATIPAGAPVTVATEGKVWVVATNASAKVGDYVFASQTDGSVLTNASNAAQGGHTLTNFRVEAVEGESAKSLVLISNQVAAVTQAASD